MPTFAGSKESLVVNICAECDRWLVTFSTRENNNWLSVHKFWYFVRGLSAAVISSMGNNISFVSSVACFRRINVRSLWICTAERLGRIWFWIFCLPKTKTFASTTTFFSCRRLLISRTLASGVERAVSHILSSLHTESEHVWLYIVGASLKPRNEHRNKLWTFGRLKF